MLVKNIKLLKFIILLIGFSVTAQKVKLKGLVINPYTLEKKEYPKVTIGIKGSKKTKTSNKKGKFKIKGKGTFLTITSKEYLNLEEKIPVNARKVLILVDEHRSLVKFLGKKDKFEDFYEEAKEELETIQGLVINPNALEYKEYPKVTIAIEGSKKTITPNKKGEFKIKRNGAYLSLTSEEYHSFRATIPSSAKKVLILVDKHRGLMKFLEQKDKFEDFYEKAKTEFEKIEVVKFVVEQLPAFPGCKGLHKKKRGHCFNKKMNSHVARNFNTDLINELGLNSGKYRVLIEFTINEQGETENVNVRAPHSRLVKEAKRIIKKLPKLIPAKQRGIPIRSQYSLPIYFMVE